MRRCLFLSFVISGLANGMLAKTDVSPPLPGSPSMLKSSPSRIHSSTMNIQSPYPYAAHLPEFLGFILLIGFTASVLVCSSKRVKRQRTPRRRAGNQSPNPTAAQSGPGVEPKIRLNRNSVTFDSQAKDKDVHLVITNACSKPVIIRISSEFGLIHYSSPDYLSIDVNQKATVRLACTGFIAERCTDKAGGQRFILSVYAVEAIENNCRHQYKARRQGTILPTKFKIPIYHSHLTSKQTEQTNDFLRRRRHLENLPSIEDSQNVQNAVQSKVTKNTFNFSGCGGEARKDKDEANAEGNSAIAADEQNVPGLFDRST